MSMQPVRRFLLLTVGLLALNAVSVADVRIDGLSGELLTNAQAHLTLDAEPCDANAARIRRLARLGEDEIQVAAEALGFYNVEISAQTSEISDCWQVVYTVAPGEPVRIRDLDLSVTGEASQDAAVTRLIDASPVKQDAIFRSDQYENLKRSLMTIMTRLGYADAKLSRHQVDVFPGDDAADVYLSLESGERYDFGEIRIDQDVIDIDLARRYLSFKQGEPYDGRKLTNLYSVLVGSGYFEEVQIEAMLEERADGEIPIRIFLTPGKRKVYSVGIGYSTNLGVRLSAGYTNRRIDKLGHQWGANLLLSDVVSEITANYRMPLANPQTEWLSFDAGYKHEVTDTSKSDTYQVGARRIQERSHDWREIQFIDFQVEDFVVGEDSGTSTMIIPGISWTRTRSENRLRPDRGSRLFFEFRGSADTFGSDANFIQGQAQAKWVRRVSEKGRLLLRGHAGLSLVDDFSELPASLRFFTGGDNSIRGYAFESLGPTNDDGEVIGGKNLLVTSVEYDHDVGQNWSLAVFVDSGNAFDDFDVDAKTGAGVGFRWHSPVGPLRVDLAHPFDDPDDSFRIHITFGPDL